MQFLVLKPRYSLYNSVYCIVYRCVLCFSVFLCCVLCFLSSACVCFYGPCCRIKMNEWMNEWMNNPVLCHHIHLLQVSTFPCKNSCSPIFVVEVSSCCIVRAAVTVEDWHNFIFEPNAGWISVLPGQAAGRQCLLGRDNWIRARDREVHAHESAARRLPRVHAGMPPESLSRQIVDHVRLTKRTAISLLQCSPWQR